MTFFCILKEEEMAEYPEPELDTTLDDNPVQTDYEPTDADLAAIDAEIWDDDFWTDDEYDFGEEDDPDELYPREESDLY